MIVTDSKKKSILLSVDELTQWGLLTDVFWAACSRLEQAAAPTNTPTSAPNPKSVPKKASTLDKLKAHFDKLPDKSIDEKQCKLLKNLLISSFHDTFKDDLINLLFLVGSEEEIHFIDDPTVTPLNVIRPRAIPIGWRREADLLVRNLLKAKIIERVLHVTQWCSPVPSSPNHQGKA